jgi:hypothetical protein
VLVPDDGADVAHGTTTASSSSLFLLGGAPLLPLEGAGNADAASSSSSLPVGDAFLSFFPPPGLGPPGLAPIGHGRPAVLASLAAGSEPLATKQEAGAAAGALDETIGLEEDADDDDGGDAGGKDATQLSLAQALKRLHALGQETAALAADKARLARHLEQVEGASFLLGAEKERLADEAAHLRAEVARLEAAVAKGKEGVRDLEEEVEELRLTVKRAEDKAEAYHGALIKERQWHKVGCGVGGGRLVIDGPWS